MREALTSWVSYSSIFDVIIVLSFLGHILREKKPPTSTIAWLLLLIIHPYIGFLLYVLLGSRKYKNEKPIIPKSPDEGAGTDNPIQHILLLSGSAPPCWTEKISLKKTGSEAYESLMNLIRDATTSIYIETYIFKNDHVGKLILSELTEKAKQGMDVRILLDSIGAHLPSHPSFGEFKRAGGKFQMFLPVFKRPNLRNHRKQIIIDHRISMIGGMNIGDEYLGPHDSGNAWLDLAVEIHGALTLELEKVFLSDWAFATDEALELPVSQQTHSGENYGQVVRSGPDVLSDPIYDLLLTSFFRAKERIWITTPYFIPDEALAKALELAARRGVDVRLCMPLKSNHLLADLGRRTYLQQLWSSGVKVYFYPTMLHAKATLVDAGYAFVGSANMDARSLLLNYEIGICVYDEKSIEGFEAWNKELFAKSSTEFKALTFTEELIGGVARLFSPLL